MADIRKTFNFRDGVQVDDEVLVVRGNRVGLGTTSPDQLLDVRGNANITGVTSTVNFNVTGVGTFNQVKVGNNIILDATSGVMTATTFKGDGASLSNIPTSQWTNVNQSGESHRFTMTEAWVWGLPTQPTPFKWVEIQIMV